MQLARQTLSQAVSAAVLERIRSGEFGPGDRLPTEKMLMEQYGVGRNSVREAVQALVTLGLVEVRPGRGATVIGIESENALDSEILSALLKEEAVDDLCAFRRLLEAETSACAALNATGDQIAEIARCAAAFEHIQSLRRRRKRRRRRVPRVDRPREPQQCLRHDARRGERADRKRPPPDGESRLGRRSRNRGACSRARRNPGPGSRCGRDSHAHATSTARSRRSTRVARSASRSS